MTTARDSLPAVPVSYAVLAMELAAERGVPQEAVLQGIDLPLSVLAQPEARIPMSMYGRITARTMHLSGDPGLGLLYGLRSTLTSHGFLGLGVMSQPTQGRAVEFFARYMTLLRFPCFSSQRFVEGGQAVIDVRDAAPVGSVRTYMFEALLTGLLHVLRPCVPFAEIELWFEWPEPDYYAAYRDRLPPARFHTGVNQLRFPAHRLDQALDTANPRTAQLVAEHCERELALLGLKEDLLDQMRAILAGVQGSYPDLEAMSARLRISSRTLKRKLAQRGLSYKRLIAETRYRQSLGLLREQGMTIETVAERMGYSAASNFSRAFQRWSGAAPGEFRDRRIVAPPPARVGGSPGRGPDVPK